MSEPQIPLDDPLAPQAQPSTTTAVLEREQVEEQLQEPATTSASRTTCARRRSSRAPCPATPSSRSAARSGCPGRDPKKFPVCPTCKEIYEGLRAPQDGGE